MMKKLLEKKLKTRTVVGGEKPKFHEPPIKVIRALVDFKSPDSSKLSFMKGDFFYVTSYDLKYPQLYHVINPSTNADGIVDSVYFEDLNRTVKGAPISPLDKNDPIYAKESDNRRRTYSKPSDGYQYAPGLPPRQSKPASILSYNSMISPEENEKSLVKGATRRTYMPLFPLSVQTNNLEIAERAVSMAGLSESSVGERNSGFNLSQVQYLIVLDKANDKYPIVLKSKNGTYRTIHRTFTELFAFHYLLLETFPDYNGANASPRRFPFLMNIAKASSSRNPKREIETYLLESKMLPADLLSSPLWVDFLALRQGDYEKEESVGEDPTAVLDFISEYENSTSVRIKISVPSGNTYAFKLEESASLEKMIKSLGSRLNCSINSLYYWDERKKMVMIAADADLQLLLRTCPNLLLYSK